MKNEMTYPDNVLALTLVDANTLADGKIAAETKVRIGARRSETNLTHPEIVSAPTQRIPEGLAKGILDLCKKSQDLNSPAPFRPETISNFSTNGHHPIIYAVESLLSRKLGLSDHLEQKNIRFSAISVLSLVGWANYPNLIGVSDAPYPERENLKMINIRVHIHKGADLFPSNTASYHFSRWVTAENYCKMMDGKDVSQVGLDGFRFCVDGLCVATTYEIIKSEFTLQRTEQVAADLHLVNE